VSVGALLILFVLAAAVAVLARRGEPDFVYSRQGVPRPESSGALSVVIVAGTASALGVASILALEGDPLGEVLSVVAVVCGGLAGILGGGPIAVAVLDLADPTTGPADGVRAPDPPVGPWFDPQRPLTGPPVPPQTLVPPGPAVPGTPGADPTAGAGVGAVGAARSAGPVGPDDETRPLATAAGAPPGAVATAAVAPAGPADPRLLRGGLWIGALERGAVVGSFLTGFPEGLALVLVVKGFGRFPELHQPAAAERFIIGTLVSILWASCCAGVTITLIG
jgi:hypothetical protein